MDNINLDKAIAVGEHHSWQWETLKSCIRGWIATIKSFPTTLESDMHAVRCYKNVLKRMEEIEGLKKGKAVHCNCAWDEKMRNRG